MAKDPQFLLQHILDAINQIEEYIEGYNFTQFKQDKKTQDAVIRQLEIIGEAASKLESSFRQANPDIPWRELSDFRNVLAHEYWDVDLEIVWKAATQEIKELDEVLQPILRDLERI